MAPYCPICWRAFHLEIAPHESRAYSITPLGHQVLAAMRLRGQKASA